MIVCAPVRYATGLIKTKDAKKADHPDKERLMTWDAIEGELTAFSPDYDQFPTKTVYKKKIYKASNLQSIQINITAGDVVTFNVKTYEGEEIEGALSEESVICLKPLPPYSKESRDKVEIIDLDKKEEDHKTTEEVTK